MRFGLTRYGKQLSKYLKTRIRIVKIVLEFCFIQIPLNLVHTLYRGLYVTKRNFFASPTIFFKQFSICTAGQSKNITRRCSTGLKKIKKSRTFSHGRAVLSCTTILLVILYSYNRCKSAGKKLFNMSTRRSDVTLKLFSDPEC